MLGFSAIGSAPVGSLGVEIQSLIIRPIGDLVTGGWLPSSGTSLYDMIDETELSVLDYITSPDLTVSLNSVSFSISETPPGTYNLRFNAKQTADNAQARLLLKDGVGATVGVGQWHTLTNTFTTHESVVTTTGTAVAAVIEPYTLPVDQATTAPTTALLAGF